VSSTRVFVTVADTKIAEEATPVDVAREEVSIEGGPRIADAATGSE
jgi:hypothetical protein